MYGVLIHTFLYSYLEVPDHPSSVATAGTSPCLEPSNTKQNNQVELLR